MNSLYDPNDDRVKKIVIDYARSQYQSDVLSMDYDDLELTEYTDPYGRKSTVVHEIDSWGMGRVDLNESIKTIVNNAILDLLTK